ncbi:MAG: hypothetical protein U0792_18400 [Gemmataceae bacterium]
MLAQSDRLAGLRRLDLSRNNLTPRAAKVLSVRGFGYSTAVTGFARLPHRG